MRNEMKNKTKQNTGEKENTILIEAEDFPFKFTSQRPKKGYMSINIGYEKPLEDYCAALLCTQTNAEHGSQHRLRPCFREGNRR